MLIYLANLADEEVRCELSDFAVNTLRDLAATGRIPKGCGTATAGDLNTLVAEETARIKTANINLDETGLTPYLRLRRPGSPFRLDRWVRTLVFAIVATRQEHFRRQKPTRG